MQIERIIDEYDPRIEAILDEIGRDPKTSAEEIESAVNMKLFDPIETGVRSEKRAIKLLSKVRGVDRVTYSTIEEDRKKGIDLWVHLEKFISSEKIAIQVKSSIKYATGAIKENYIKSKLPGYCPKIILICGEQRNDQEIINYFLRRLIGLTGIDLTRYQQILHH